MASKSHQGRAGQAAKRAVRLYYDDEAIWVDEAIPIIARETFPSELVQAAKAFLEALDTPAKTAEEFERVDGICMERRAELEAILAFYPEKEAP